MFASQRKHGRKSMNWRQKLWRWSTYMSSLRDGDFIPKAKRLYLYPLRSVLFPIEMFNYWRARGHPLQWDRDGYMIQGKFVPSYLVYCLGEHEWICHRLSDEVLTLVRRDKWERDEERG